MKVYIFGNSDTSFDTKAINIQKRLTKDFPELDFIQVDVNRDLPFETERKVILIDTVEGISEVELITADDLTKLDISQNKTVHDFDLGFQLRLLQKLGKLKELNIIGIPMIGKLDYLRIHLILRKLVAQDIQGS